jgi:hypothetical protein
MLNLSKRLETLEATSLAMKSKPIGLWTDRELWEFLGVDPDGPLPSDEELQAIVESEREMGNAKS